MPTLWDPLDKHDWSSEDYVQRWAERQDEKEIGRREPFELLAKTIPYPSDAPIKILDVGAGYGGLAQFLLQQFPNATAVCHDGSEEMADLGRRRMEHLGGRFTYALSDFSRPGWSAAVHGPFEVVVSAIAIHNVRSAETIRAIYTEIFSLVKPGGCFLNFDRTVPSLDELLIWLDEAGFERVQCFWREGKRALFGGFKSAVRGG